MGDVAFQCQTQDMGVANQILKQPNQQSHHNNKGMDGIKIKWKKKRIVERKKK